MTFPLSIQCIHFVQTNKQDTKMYLETSSYLPGVMLRVSSSETIRVLCSVV